MWPQWEPVAVPGGLIVPHTLTGEAVTLTVRVRGVNYGVVVPVRSEAVAIPGTPAMFQVDGSYPLAVEPFAVARVLFADQPYPLPGGQPPTRQCVLCAEPAAAGEVCPFCPPGPASEFAHWLRWVHSLRASIQ